MIIPAIRKTIRVTDHALFQAAERFPKYFSRFESRDELDGEMKAVLSSMSLIEKRRRFKYSYRDKESFGHVDTWRGKVFLPKRRVTVGIVIADAPLEATTFVLTFLFPLAH